MISARVREMMEAHGVGKRAQAKTLARILGMSYSAATRKIKGRMPWKLEQIKEVAGHFNEPVERLIAASAARPSIAGASQSGTFIVANRQFPCTAWISEHTSNGPEGASYLALQHVGQWLVYPAADLPPLSAYRVDRIQLDGSPASRRQPTIAVVDDEPDTVSSLCDYFNSKGLLALAYDSLQAFEDALRRTVFDGVVIDWLFHGQTAAGTIARIRSSDSAGASIFLLTGQLVTGRADEDEIAAVVQRFALACLEKPVRPSILLAEMVRKLGLR